MLNDKEWIEQLNVIRERLLHEMTFEVAMMTPKTTAFQEEEESNVTNNQELAQCITNHIRAVLYSNGPKVHALAHIGQLFVREIYNSYGGTGGGRDANDRHIREIVSNVLTDISACTDKLLSALLLKYWFNYVIEPIL